MADTIEDENDQITALMDDPNLPARTAKAKGFSNQLYTMFMGEVVVIPGTAVGNTALFIPPTFVRRVPGGWTFNDTFVPWHPEDCPQWLKAATEAGFFDPDVIVPPLED